NYRSISSDHKQLWWYCLVRRGAKTEIGLVLDAPIAVRMSSARDTSYPGYGGPVTCEFRFRKVKERRAVESALSRWSWEKGKLETESARNAETSGKMKDRRREQLDEVAALAARLKQLGTEINPEVLERALVPRLLSDPNPPNAGAVAQKRRVIKKKGGKKKRAGIGRKTK
ncbi:hypothetical protein FOZ60_010471, partial [Perkinsus olseni]